MMSTHPVELSALTKRFDETLALDAVDWTLSAGAAVGLVGRNGSGKTTLLQTVVGLLRPTSGRVETLGCPAERLDEDRLARLGFVDQDANLLDWLTVEQHVRYVASYQPRWDAQLEKRLREALELESKPRVGVLSKGMRQRLALLLAVCHRPQLLLLDEPVSALDPVARQEALALILERVIEDGASVVISSHVLHDVEKVVDRVLCLDAGQVVADASLDTLKEAFAEWIVTPTAGDLPARWSESFVLAGEGGGRQARLTVRAGDEELERFRAQHGVHVERRSLGLEQIFPLLSEGRS